MSESARDGAAATPSAERTFWNGEPTPARKVTGIVLDAPEFSEYWARPLVGTRRNAVEVTYGGETFYLDDDEALLDAILPEYAKALGVPFEPRVRPAGSGWAKVTEGRGSPGYGHGELRLDDVIARAEQFRFHVEGTDGFVHASSVIEEWPK